MTVIAVDAGGLTALGVAKLGGTISDNGLVSASIVLLAVSLFVTLWVLGSLPLIAEKIEAEQDAAPSIYMHTNWARVPLWVMAFGGHATLMAAVVILGIFLSLPAALEQSGADLPAQGKELGGAGRSAPGR